MARAQYARKAYTYVNHRGTTVRVPARSGPAAPMRPTRGPRPGGATRGAATSAPRVPRSSVPAPSKRPKKGQSRFKVDSPLKALLPTPKRVLGKISTKQGVQRVTQKGAAKNAVKRQTRRQVRKVLPGTSIIKIRR